MYKAVTLIVVFLSLQHKYQLKLLRIILSKLVNLRQETCYQYHNCHVSRTSVDERLPASRQAVSGEDFIARQGMVVLQENVTSAPVEIVIKQVCDGYC